jgi:hypothetical protein
MGGATLVVYLFHGFFVKGAEYAGLPGWAGDHPVLSLVVVTAAAVVLALVLAWRPVSGRLTDLVDPFGFAERHTKDAAVLALAAEQPMEELLELPPDLPPERA